MEKNIYQTPHCVKCGNCHLETECTTFVEPFYWPYQGQQVFVIGEWSGWKNKEPMIKMDDYFVCQVSLNPGSYQHKFVVDGEWRHDENEPVIVNELGSLNNVKLVIPKRAYLDEYYICQQDDDFVQITIETNLIQDGMKIIGSWDGWSTQKPLHLQTNLLKNAYVNSIKIKLQKGQKYEFKFKNQKGSYFIDDHYPALLNEKGTFNNYLVASSYSQAKTPKPVLEYLSLSKSTSAHQTQWEWEKQCFEQLQSYNLYGHSLTCIGDMLYIFGGIYKNEFRDYLIKIPLCDLTKFQQQKVNFPPRAYHAGLADGNKLIIFGGINTGVLGDCKIYNTATDQWSQSLTINGVPPSSREKQTSALYKDFIIVYGGYFCCPKTGVQIIHNDIHILNTQSMTWNKPSTGIINAPAKFAHTATIFEDCMLVFGGISQMSQNGDTNELWKLTINKDHLIWSNVETHGSAPCPRHGHTANIINRHLIIFGGSNQKQIFNDVFMLDLDTMIWNKPIISGQIPKPVTYHAAAQVSNQLIVIGGKTSSSKYTPDVLILKPKRQRRKSFSVFSQNSEETFYF